MAKIDKSHVQEVIEKLNSTFDTHEFIKQFTKDFEREYVELLCKHKYHSNIFKSAHAEIGKFLADKSSDLHIEKLEKTCSDNIKDYPSENQRWCKI